MTPTDFSDSLAFSANEAMGRSLKPESLSWLARPEGKSAVEDATMAAFMDGTHRRDDVVLLVSNADYPDMVAQAVERGSDVAKRVSEDLAQRIHRPVAEGRVEGRSYAAFPRLRALSERRITRRLEAECLSGAVRNWLASVALSSRREADSETKLRLFEAPLAFVAADGAMPRELKQAAEVAMSRAVNADLVVNVEHGDFWSGNIMLSREGPRMFAASTGRFKVIDWGGAWIDGYPFADLVRFSLSVRSLETKRSSEAVEAYRKSLDLPPQHVLIYGLASIGRLGLNLNAFPRARYIALAIQLFEFYRHRDYSA